jgi:hypothetical protein
MVVARGSGENYLESTKPYEHDANVGLIWSLDPLLYTRIVHSNEDMVNEVN